MPNKLEEELRTIQQYRNIAKQLIKKEQDADKRVKLAQKIAYYNNREKEILNQLNLKLNDIKLTEKKDNGGKIE